MVLDEATNRDEVAIAGPVPDEGDVHEQLKGTWGFDKLWINTELLWRSMRSASGTKASRTRSSGWTSSKVTAAAR